VERGSIKLDLHRRDFTINTLALRLDGHHYGQLHDYWGGYNDLRQGLVRVLHSISFIDDPTRMLRAARFEQRFRFHIEERTLELMKEALPLLERVSGERIRHELNHILADGHVAWIMRRLHELELLAAIHPALTWDSWLHEHFTRLEHVLPSAQWGITGYRSERELHRDLSYTLWLLRLPGEAARQVCARLVTSVDLARTVLDAGRLWQDLPALAAAAPSAVVERLDGLKPLARYAVFLAANEEDLRRPLRRYVMEWQDIQPTIDGHDLRRMGLPPSPVYSEILERLRAAWLDGQVDSTEEEQRRLAEILAEPGVQARLADAPQRGTPTQPTLRKD
jgi:tRNA nucleotidyltransferase (CCA-adding enzyme)